MGFFLKRLIKPKTIIGKVTGAVGSVLGISGGGIALGGDVSLFIIVGLSIAAGYLFGWSKDQVQSFISFLNTEKRKK